MTKAMQTFRCKARFALTGTAIQNSMRELYTLAEWTNTGLLGTVKSGSSRSKSLSSRVRGEVLIPSASLMPGPEQKKLVKNVLPIFFLRRTKALIADQLPRKFDKIVFCHSPPRSIEVYKRILSEDEVDLMKRHADPVRLRTARP